MASPSEAVKDMFVAIESLRNSFGLLVEFLPKFVQKHLQFQHRAGQDPELIREFWVALDVASDMVDLLVKCNLWFENGQLFADPSCEGEEAIEEIFKICDPEDNERINFANFYKYMKEAVAVKKRPVGGKK